MMSEKEKMLRGERYFAPSEELVDLLRQTRLKLQKYNTTLPTDQPTLDETLRSIIDVKGKQATVLQPFRCDYGWNVSVGENFFANFNLTILDEAKVTIGDNVFIGPNVGIYTACHPIEPDERNKGIEWAEPISIGDNVWIGGGVTICPGVSIGNNSTIGAGSVVVRDIPDWCVAVGNPAHVIKTIEH